MIWFSERRLTLTTISASPRTTNVVPVATTFSLAADADARRTL